MENSMESESSSVNKGSMMFIYFLFFLIIVFCALSLWLLSTNKIGMGVVSLICFCIFVIFTMWYVMSRSEKGMLDERFTRYGKAISDNSYIKSARQYGNSFLDPRVRQPMGPPPMGPPSMGPPPMGSPMNNIPMNGGPPPMVPLNNGNY